jgi:hypothetical protein
MTSTHIAVHFSQMSDADRSRLGAALTAWEARRAASTG